MTQLTYELICRYPESVILYDGKPYAVAMISDITGMVVLETIDEGRTGWVDIAKCQLMLRTWEDMTDDEMIKLKETIFPNAKPNSEKVTEMVNELIRTDRAVNRYNIDYLRSISISTEPTETEGTYRVRANTIN